LLYDQGTRGRVTAGYRVSADGDLSADDALSSGRPLRKELFKDAALGERFARMANASFPSRYRHGAKVLAETLPAPIPVAGRARTRDLNADGKADAVQVSTGFSSSLLLDADQSFVPQLKPEFRVAKVDSKSFDPEIAAVTQGTHMWVFYDRDDDGHFELVLHTPQARHYVARDAWTLGTDGSRRAAPEHLGRKLFRAALLNDAEQADRVSSMVKRSGLLSIMSAKDEGMGTFPDPVNGHRGAGYSLLELKRAPRSVVTIIGRGSDGYLMDLDRSSGLFGPLKSIDVRKVVKSGKFDPEVAYFQRNGLAWTFYDTDNKDGYDLILVGLSLNKGTSDAAFRIAGNKVSFDAALVGGPLVRPSLIKSAQSRARLKQIAGELFAESMVEKD
jgi:hypothetical protein